MRQKTRKGIIALHIILYCALFLWFYPSIPQISDESEYFRNAVLLAQGSIGTTAPEYAYNYVGAGSMFVSRYPLTASMFLVPLVQIGIWALFLFGFFFYLIGLYFLLLLLKSAKLSPLWSLLYVSYLPFIFHSTTVMTDLPSAALIVGMLHFYYNKRFVHAGIFGALSLLLRVTNVLAIGALFLVLISERPSWRDVKRIASRMGIPLLVCIGILAVQNKVMYGSAFASGYGFLKNNVQFLWDRPEFLQLVLQNMRNYVLMLNLLYPLMLLCAIIAKYPLKKFTLLYAALLLAFVSLVNNLPGFDLQSLIIDYRYVFPLIPFLFVGYAAFIKQQVIPRSTFLKRHGEKVLATGCMLLLLSAIPMLSMKQEASERTRAIVDDLYQHTDSGSLIIGTQEGSYFNEQFGKRGYISLLRPVAFDNSEELAAEKIKEYLDAEHKVYLLFVDAPHYDYKRGISKTKENLEAIQTTHASTEVYSKVYGLEGAGYANAINVTLVEIKSQ